MNNTIIKILMAIIMLIGFTKSVYADELKPKDNHQFSFFSGIFDFSDKGKNSEIIGVQHLNEDLFRDSFLGKIRPVTGFMMTADSASYFYTGVQAEYDLGKLNITPSFTPGLYSEGNGKDLGHPIEFKSEVELNLHLSKGSLFGVTYHHISNADIGDENPGSDSILINFKSSF